MIRQKVTYSDLNAKQQELFNFTKLASALIDYNLVAIKLDDDYLGADFLIYDADNDGKTIKVQLKGRINVESKYIGKNLYMAFPLETHGDEWVIIDHDKLAELWMTGNESKSWNHGQGGYSAKSVPKQIMAQVIDMSLYGILKIH
ncbi:MAG: hypothetical protein LBT37_04390 [Lactobacillaceae bacterium]|jgi:hypothetical protein|nr:hypothetical protein [Lactobacillaceae bacterium]